MPCIGRCWFRLAVLALAAPSRLPSGCTPDDLAQTRQIHLQHGLAAVFAVICARPVFATDAMRIRNQKDFFAGLLFMLVGLAFAWGASQYRIGSSASMGPGYFPLMLGLMLALLGVAIVLRALAWRAVADAVDPGKVGAWAFKPLFFIIAANLLFGLLLGGLPRFDLPAMGLVLAIYGLTAVAGMAGERFSLKESLLLATVLAVGIFR